MKHITPSFILTALLLCACGTNTPNGEITAEMALNVRSDAGTIELLDYLGKKD